MIFLDWKPIVFMGERHNCRAIGAYKFPHGERRSFLWFLKPIPIELSRIKTINKYDNIYEIIL